MHTIKPVPIMRTKETPTDEGFTLTEVVITVAIVLIVSVVGFLSWQGFSDNAKRSAVESAANEVFTAVSAAKVLPDGASSAQAIVNDYNDTSDEYLRVELEEIGLTDFTVTAYGWEDEDPPYIAVRSTIPELDGSEGTPGEGETGDEEEDTSFTGDIEDYDNGTFTFKTGKSASKILLYGLSDNATIDHDSFEEPRKLTEGLNELPIAGEYTISGGFKHLGSRNSLSQIEKAMSEADEQAIPDEMLEDYTNLSEYMEASPFAGTESSISEWEDTGTISLNIAFISSSINEMTKPPSTVESMSGMFYGAGSFNQNIGDWDVSNVTDMSNMFYYAEKFNRDIGGWDVSNVTDMSYMFHGAESFNQPLDEWETGSVKSMEFMFQDATDFDQDIGGWDVSNVTNMSYIFSFAETFNQDISMWKTNSVENMENMFWSASSFNQDVSKWDISNVTNMRGMFSYARSFNQDIGGWDVSNVTDMSYMFESAKSFNQDISRWDVSQVEYMLSMFLGAESFDQDLSLWEVPKIAEKPYMFDEFSHPEFEYNTAKHPRWGES